MSRRARSYGAERFAPWCSRGDTGTIDGTANTGPICHWKRDSSRGRDLLDRRRHSLTSARDRRFHCREIELHDLGEPWLGVAIGPEQPLFLRVTLDQIDDVCPAGEGEIAKGLPVHREVRGRCSVLGTHVRKRGSVCHRKRRQPVTEELDEGPHHTVRPQHLRQRQDQVGGRRAGGKRTPRTSGCGRKIG